MYKITVALALFFCLATVHGQESCLKYIKTNSGNFRGCILEDGPCKMNWTQTNIITNCNSVAGNKCYGELFQSKAGDQTPCYMAFESNCAVNNGTFVGENNVAVSKCSKLSSMK
ncbi:hypothetical protein BY458DRAFT_488585 [Sporodiniella umbellata]|nr:hypothetical protein BY458DRAFT_488585 [Sporodiniella umbellata]